jgi:phosphatidylglycerol:prolipoprotein diacylglycerol transferase
MIRRKLVVQAYPVVLGVGCIAALGWLIGRRSGADEADDRPQAAGIALAAGLAGARIGFAALHAAYFRDHPLETLWLWEGGLSWVGAAVGVVIGIALFARFRRQSAWSLADELAVPAVIVALAAWTGCLLDQCVYGIPLDASPFAVPSADIFGIVVPRWPTAAVGMIAVGALAALLILLSTRALPTGGHAALALGGVAAIALGLSFTRGDPSMLVGGVRLDTLAAAAVLAAGALAGGRIWAVSRHV